MDNLATVIEGILFSSTEPKTAEQIIKIFPEDERPGLGEVHKILNDLQSFYGSRGIHLSEVASGYKFVVANDAVPFIQRTLEEKPQKYSRALLETLSLIAYRQPITRAEIEDIRGVAVSTNIIRTLTEQGWVRAIGHKEVPGRPALYATTKGFLDHFGLAHLEDLPPLAELKDLNAIDPNVVGHAQDEALKAQAESEAEEDTEVTEGEVDTDVEGNGESTTNEAIPESAEALPHLIENADTTPEVLDVADEVESQVSSEESAETTEPLDTTEETEAPAGM